MIQNVCRLLASYQWLLHMYPHPMVNIYRHMLNAFKCIYFTFHSANMLCQQKNVFRDFWNDPYVIHFQKHGTKIKVLTMVCDI